VAIRADIELGGSDQKFNLLVARELMREQGMSPQCILTMPLLVGLDGVNKMSKSLDNAIGITEPTDEIFGKTMSIPDEMMADYMALTLSYPPERVKALLAEVEAGKLHPRDLKADIAESLAARYAGRDQAKAARARFDSIFRDGEVDPDAEQVQMALGGEASMRIVNVVVGAGMAATNGEARRLVKQGGVSVNGEKVADPVAELTAGEYMVKVGKRRFRHIRLT